MKVLVPPIIFTDESSEDAEQAWQFLYSRIFTPAIERLQRELE